MGDKDMKRDDLCQPTALDPLYRLAMLRICDLRSEAMSGREYRRARASGKLTR